MTDTMETGGLVTVHLRPQQVSLLKAWCALKIRQSQENTNPVPSLSPDVFQAEMQNIIDRLDGKK